MLTNATNTYKRSHFYPVNEHIISLSVADLPGETASWSMLAPSELESSPGIQ